MKGLIKEARYNLSDGNRVLDSVLDIKYEGYEATLRLVLNATSKPMLTIIVESYEVNEQNSDKLSCCYTTRVDNYKTIYLEDIRCLRVNGIPNPNYRYLHDAITELGQGFIDTIEVLSASKADKKMIQYYVAFLDSHIALSKICLLSK